MQIIEDLTKGPFSLPRVVLTLGNFDGLHIGHQAIMSRVVERARERQGTPVVFTFRNHPLSLLCPNKVPPLLSTLEEKSRLLTDIGIEIMVCPLFTAEIAQKTPSEFLSQLVSPLLSPELIVVGHDYAFGRERAGNITFLAQQAGVYGYELEVLEAIAAEGLPASSTLIRKLLTAGQVTKARTLLGRPYSITAAVIQGKGRGADLGYPTANLGPQPKLMPRDGVYAVQIEYQGKRYPGVANIGSQPTFGQHPRTLEAHLLGFSGNLYGQVLTINFEQWLRAEQTFPSKKHLSSQIKKDIDTAAAILA